MGEPRGHSCAVSVGLSCCDEDDKLGDEKDEADGEHSDTDGGGPGEVEVEDPIVDYEGETAEEEDGTSPSPETWRDFAVAFVLGAADFANGLDA
jgi:hypothetical protein